MKNISLELYRVFWEVGKSLNLTRAAERLYVTQPSVSLALKTLETQLGLTLCIRSKRGVTLTAEGSVLFRELDRAFKGIGAAEKALDKMANLESGSIYISAGDTICNYYLLDYIINFKKKYPDIKLQITNRTSSDTVSLLKEGLIDFGFINLPFEDDTQNITLCCEISEVLCCGKDYINLAQNSINLKDIENYPVVMLEKSSSSRLFLDSVFDKAGIASKPVYELGSIDLVMSFIKNNLAIGFLPYELCASYIDNKTIIEIPLTVPLPKRGIALAEPRNGLTSYAAAAFKDFILNT